MISSKSFVLFCAGEDSGDALGAEFVAETRRMGFEARGTGGRLMEAAGLDLVADFDELPVSGFGDVVPRYFRLRKIYQSLLKALKSEDCVALVAIDYPGFNMKLSVTAKALSKPVLYVAPPQIWAWKENRAKRLKDARLAVLFEFEQQAYGRHGCTALRLQHPFAAALSQLQSEVPSAKNSLTGPSSDSQTIFLLPGSRKAQALRNVNFYLRVASAYHRLHPESTFIVLLPRTSLQEELQKIAATYFAQGLPSYLSFQVSPAAPSERAALFTRATAVLSAPGTATLEVALCGVPLVVATKPDVLTYSMGKLLLKTKTFALPNILQEKRNLEKLIPEFILSPFADSKKSVPAVLTALESAGGISSTGANDYACDLAAVEGTATAAKNLAEFLKKELSGATPRKLTFEFLSQFV